MLVAALAVLLAGDPQMMQVPATMLPAGRPVDGTPGQMPAAPRLPASLTIDFGWAATTQVDPYGRSGRTSFQAGMPLAGIRLRGQVWYAELCGQLMFSSLTNRNVTGSIRRDVFTTGSLRWGLGIEVADVRFRREDFRSGDILVGTNRTATVGMGALSAGIGPYRGMSLRLTALAGMYQNRYGSLIDLPGFSGDEPLADDEVPITGAQVTVAGLTFRDRVELGGSVRYLHIARNHSTSVPASELSGSVSLDIRLFRIRSKQLSIGAFARFGPSGPSIITDKTFGLRGTYKLR